MSMNDWLFQGPNLILAALMYTLIGRFILSLFYPPDSDRTIWRVFCSVTDPLLNMVTAITPKIVPDRLIMIFTVIWLVLARLFLLLTFVAAGIAPRLG